MANLDPVIGSEQGGIRPVLIIQNDLGNQYGTTVIVAALTTQSKKPTMPTHVTIPKGEGGLWRDSMLLAEQVRTIEKSRLLRLLGTVSPAMMQQVNHALSVSLDVQDA